MKKFVGFQAGANLGHWISQYKYGNANGDKEIMKKQDEHFKEYIKESDFARMSEWGLDHVRVPVDYYLFEDDATPGIYNEERLYFVDFALEMCKKYGLNMLLDLHHAPGFTFNFGYDSEKNNLFQSEQMQQRYINIWRMFAERYKNEGDNLAFELLNELVVSDCSYWNKLWQKTADEILKISPNRKIVIGSNDWNSVNHLQYLDVRHEDNYIYNFHTYEPFIFTHQRASWNENTANYMRSVLYPVERAQHADWIDRCVSKDLKYFEREIFDKDFLWEYIQPAIDFSKKHDMPLYCGEYGVYFHADDRSAERWLDDITSILNDLGIGHAVWSYRGFSNITDKNNNVVSEKMVEYITRK